MRSALTITALTTALAMAGCGGSDQPTKPTGEGSVQQRLQAIDAGYTVRCGPAGNGEDPAVTCVITRKAPIASSDIASQQRTDALRFAERELARDEPGAGRLEFRYTERDSGETVELACNRSYSDGTDDDGQGSYCGD